MRVIRLFICAMVLAGLVGCTHGRDDEPRSGAPSNGERATVAGSTACAVTLPNQMKPPGVTRFSMPPVYHGNGKLWVKLWPHGVIVARPMFVGRDGSIFVKLPWYRGVRGRLVVSGQRLDGKAPPLHVGVPTGYGDRRFQPTGLTFPRQGCWEVTGRVGATRLVFVVLVVKVDENGY